ncbi:uncharacterized protein LACBIDRAFT_313345 [Laccaria bicolor S238N-H82]|uniref:Predicted protein n=1 Tax=Laccaria bicolor (strain S238N-H82 / ATCC MYA-4686) TaxID=486041 RepID=B0DY40_LACBS|nr:uncharacterized protein LACBIDRAFT_313345 [Laccaria bicolor S238N-H82]EDR00452.1 predicted protein [Laccaria bicolor S238N-H82]|eukprot:XP_001888844.1 predicted protein [Laccaria bicolor S238N-H82]
MPRQSKNLADKLIEEIIQLKEDTDSCNKEIYKFEGMIQSGRYEDGWDVSEVRVTLAELKEKCNKLEKAYKSKRGMLGTDGRLQLDRLLGNKFLKVQINALALKKRLRTRLQQRKFELDGLERAYRKTNTNEKKLLDHSVSQIKRKEPGIQQLAKKYNELCGELEAMIKKKQAPRGARAPHPIASDGLFKLDVDDDIWQDVGLDETDLLPGGEIPNWLGDENVRKGIKSMLELDRCNEEERRLSYERSAMQDWLIEEWKCVTMAMEKNEFLARLCNNWQDKTRMIDPHKPMPDSWGPSLEDLMEAHKFEMTAMVAENEREIYDDDNEEEEDDEDDEGDEEEGEETELLEAVEMVALSDEFRKSYTDSLF